MTIFCFEKRQWKSRMYIQSERKPLLFIPLLVYKTISYKNYRAVPSKPMRTSNWSRTASIMDCVLYIICFPFNYIISTVKSWLEVVIYFDICVCVMCTGGQYCLMYIEDKLIYNVLCIVLENKTFYSAFGYSVVYWWERHSSCRYPQRTNYMENKVLLDLRNIRFSCPVFFKKYPKMASMFFILQCHDVVLNHYLLLLYSTQLRNIYHIQKSESY